MALSQAQDTAGERGPRLCPPGANSEARRLHTKQLYTSKQITASALEEEYRVEEGPQL